MVAGSRENITENLTCLEAEEVGQAEKVKVKT